MKITELRKLISKPKKSKFGNVKTEYNGKTYDSKLEASYAHIIDHKIKNGEIKSVVAQYPMPVKINGVKICKYVADFMVTFPDNRVEIWDAKGVETSIFKLKWKLVKALYPEFGFEIKK